MTIQLTDTTGALPEVIPVGHGLTERSVRLLAQIDSYAALPQGWNGYRAPAPSPSAIQNAKAFILEANNFPSLAPRVEPSAMGGVGATFTAGHRETVVEFYNNGTAHALFSDDATGEMHTQSASLDPRGYEELIVAVRKYLYVE